MGENGVEPPLTHFIFRRPVPWLTSKRLVLTRTDTPQLDQHTNRSPDRCIPNLDMLRPRSRCALPLALEQSALSPCTPYPHCADFACYTPGVLGGYSPLHPAFAMGRLDQSSSYHLDYRVLCCHMRDETDAREQEGKEEADRRECGDEWCELFRQSESDSRDEYRTATSSDYWHRNGIW